MKMGRKTMKVKLKFYALRLIASIQIFFGGFLCIATVVIFFFTSLVNAPLLLGIPATLLALGIFIGGVLLIAGGEMTYVFIGIEENTRMTNELLQDYIQSKVITPVVSGTDTYESSKSMNSIFRSISSSWKKEHSIGFGILVFLIIVFFILKQLGLVQ